MTSSRQLIAGNWKMNGLRAALGEVADVARELSRGNAECDALICPPVTLIAAAAEIARGSPLQIGAQDCHEAQAGAFTGDVSAEMLRDAGATAVIVGHSERRSLHGEHSGDVRSKAEAAHRAGLLAIICIGETAGERRMGLTADVCLRQLRLSLPAGASPSNTAIAYEPVWAIGTGLTPSLHDIAAIHGTVREALPAQAGAPWRILYGGSVKPDGARDILSLKEVGGVLVGGASLKAADFLAIAACARSYDMA